MDKALEVLEKQFDWQWQAVVERSVEFDGTFWFGVRTTGIFCRPSCSSKTANRENVEFFTTPSDAERSGFRACHRCRPKDEYFPGPAAKLVRNAIAMLRANEETPTVEMLSQRLGVSSGHLQKTFKNLLGLSPKEIIDKMRIENFKPNVRETDVTTALYESGFGSSRSLYEKAAEQLGMTPATYKKGGKGLKIDFTIADSPLGKLMVAATERGICSVSFADTAEELEKELRAEFFAAEIVENDSRLLDAVTAILKGLDGERTILRLPLDIRASAFQMRVWSELRKIPFGETRTYGQVAEQIGQPTAVRAVARACATNPAAIVMPCHRVIGSDGKLTGYRWGIERKAKLLKIEKKNP